MNRKARLPHYGHFGMIDLPPMTPNNDAMIPAPAESTLPLRRLACARCGTAFECGTGGNGSACWCLDEAYRMPMPIDAHEDCLCPTCLRAAAATVGPSA